jgi:hypothetical protein
MVESPERHLHFKIAAEWIPVAGYSRYVPAKRGGGHDGLRRCPLYCEWSCPCSSVDRVPASEAGGGSSSLPGGTMTFSVD